MAVAYCPQCGKDDQIRKVTSIVTEGSTTIEYTDSLGTLAGSGSAAVQTQLARRLMPPPRPKATGCAATPDILKLLIVGLIMALVSYCGLGLVGVDVEGLEPRSEGLLIYSTSGIILVIWLLWMAYAKVKQKELQAQIARWEKAFSKWQQSYYCARCDIVFVSGENQPISPERMWLNFLFR
jgi:hypothetical protein